ANRRARTGPAQERHRPGDRDGSRGARPDLRRRRPRRRPPRRRHLQPYEPDVPGGGHDPGAGRDRGTRHRGRGDGQLPAHLRPDVEPGDYEPRRKAFLRPL
ncbi:MAG: PaaD-like protein (DUF59) involved in Fe-S cluster assembly, partial [uncultured Rubrobacteraceae bacterium]